jgi:S1-C subfamily serine protease
LDGTNRGKNQPSGNVSCYTDPSRCPEDKLCTIATQHNGSGRIWRNEKTSKYVAAAKQRGLTCGVQQAVAKPAEPVVPPAAPDVDQTYKVASGTGFFVSEEGHLITNNHVIDGCKEIKIHSKGEIFDTVTLANDPQNDLALLKSGATPDAYFSLSTELPYALQDVIVAGFPFGDRVSSSLKFTQGIVSSVTGLGNNYSEIQIDAALQPGNSGGPILDEYGNVIAVAVAKLDMKKILDDYGVIPENTNFGVKASAVRNLMEGNLVKPSKPRIRTMSKRDLSALATDATLFLSCWMTTAQIEQLKTRKVLFDQFDN